jgi:riboflavin synthase
MFQGIVRGLGTVARVEDRDGGRLRRLTVDVAGLADGVAEGQSVAVNGTCLTAVGSSGTRLEFDVIDETLRRTNLGRLAAGDRVDIELPLAWGGEISGHLVQGHVDTTARIVDRREEGEDVRVWCEVPDECLPLLVAKGSVAVDGVSLTIVDVDRPRRRFSVALIPYTLHVTTLGFKQVGDLVNVEIDHQAKLFHAALGPLLAELEQRLATLETRVAALERG